MLFFLDLAEQQPLSYACGQMTTKSFSRADKVAKLVHHELAKIIQQHSEKSDFFQVTITAVKMSRDLSHAKIFITILDDAKKTEIVKALNKEEKFFRHLLAKQLNLRIVPNVVFLYDDSVRYGNDLDALISKAVERDQQHKE